MRCHRLFLSEKSAQSLSIITKIDLGFHKNNVQRKRGFSKHLQTRRV